jgi:hypothetical protein
MNAPIRFRRLAVLLTAAALNLAPAPVRAQARPEPLKKVRVLLVIDTNSNLTEAVKIDRNNILGLLRKTIPGERYSVDLLEGDEVTPEKILDHYARLQTGPDECLFFYYTGHGGTEKKRGHALIMGARGRERLLFRSDLLKALKAKNAGLVVCLTDCCSTVFELPNPVRITVAGSTQRLHPVMEALFFRSRGVVDITAAEYDTGALCDNELGSFMTAAFKKVVLAEPRGKDGLLTWQEFFPLLKRETEGIFKNWKAKLKPADQAAIAQDNQSPAAFELPGGLPPDDGARGYRLGVGVEYLKERRCVLVREVEPRGPADRLGLEVNDEILEVNGRPLGSVKDFLLLLDNSGGRALLKLRDHRTGKIFYPNVALEPQR